VHARPSSQVLPSRAVAPQPDAFAICTHQVLSFAAGAKLEAHRVKLDLQQTLPQASTCGDDGGSREHGIHLWSVPRCSSIAAMRHSVLEWGLANASGQGVTFEFNHCGLRGLS